MFGTYINIGAILVGGLLGIIVRKGLSAQQQLLIKALLGVATIWIGLRLMWSSLNGPFLNFIKEVLVLLVALSLGRVLGRLLHIQKGLNRLGQYAKVQINDAQMDTRHQFNNGFVAATILFCAAPLAVVGGVQEGLNRDITTLVVKSIMDGLVTMSFVVMFGWSVLLAAIPLLAWQGSFTWGGQLLEPLLVQYSLLDSVNAVCGFLICAVALIMFDLKRVELADYLPALALAPLLTWIFR